MLTPFLTSSVKCWNRDNNAFKHNYRMYSKSESRIDIFY